MTEPATLATRRWERMLAPTALVGGLGLATLALHLRDPHDSYSWGVCPSAALGFSCPGCGGLRAVNDLTNLRLADAASSNLALVVAIPILIAAILWWSLSRWRGTDLRPPERLRRPAIVVALVLLAGFTLLRNLPAGAWLAP
jgi:hypothetical protein